MQSTKNCGWWNKKFRPVSFKCFEIFANFRNSPHIVQIYYYYGYCVFFYFLHAQRAPSPVGKRMKIQLLNRKPIENRPHEIQNPESDSVFPNNLPVPKGKQKEEKSSERKRTGISICLVYSCPVLTGEMNKIIDGTYDKTTEEVEEKRQRQNTKPKPKAKANQTKPNQADKGKGIKTRKPKKKPGASYILS